MISSENSTSQNKTSSPAQIRDESSDLATIIFGSNFTACEWCAKFCAINAGIESFEDSDGFKCRVPGCTHAHTHTHTHT